ncbi:hypothetical protein ACOME3_005596 [Neoechinorhynchus agilis]
MMPPVVFRGKVNRNPTSPHIRQEPNIILQAQVLVYQPEYTTQSCAPDKLHKIVDWVYHNRQSNYQSATMKFSPRGISLEYLPRVPMASASSPFIMHSNRYDENRLILSKDPVTFKTRNIKGLWLDPIHQSFIAIVVGYRSNSKNPSNQVTDAYITNPIEHQYLVIVVSLIHANNQQPMSATNEAQYIVSRFHKMMRVGRQVRNKYDEYVVSSSPSSDRQVNKFRHPDLPSGTNGGRRRCGQSMDRRRKARALIDQNTRTSWVSKGNQNRREAETQVNGVTLRNNPGLRNASKMVRRRSCSQPSRCPGENENSPDIDTSSDRCDNDSDDHGRCDDVRKLESGSNSSTDTINNGEKHFGLVVYNEGSSIEKSNRSNRHSEKMQKVEERAAYVGSNEDVKFTMFFP